MNIQIKAIYDNEGESFDRYTVITNKQDSDTNYTLCLALSHNPNSPQGMSLFCSCKEGKHLGKKIEFSELSEEIQKHILQRLK